MSSDWVEQAFRNHSVSVTKYLLLKLPYSEVDDAVSEVFEIAIKKSLEPMNHQAWLIGIAKKVALRRQKMNQQDTSRYQPLQDLAEVSNTVGFEEVIGLESGLQSLPSDQRELIELCFLVGLEKSEVCSILGISRGNLDVRIHRARRKLIEVLNVNEEVQVHD